MTNEKIIIKDYEVGLYFGNTYALKHQNSFITLNDYQVALLEELKNSGSILELVFLPNGISTKRHQKELLDLLKKIKSINLIDTPSEKTDTLEIRKPISFEGLNALAATVIGLGAKAIGIFKPVQLLALALVFGLSVLILFPFQQMTGAFQTLENFSYGNFLLITYLGMCASLSFRSLMQAAILKSEKCPASTFEAKFFGPFFIFSTDTSNIFLLGRNARMRMAFIGLLSPLVLGFIYLCLLAVHGISAPIALMCIAASLYTSLILLFPLFGKDGAELLHCVFFPNSIEQKTSQDFADALLGIKRLGKELILYVALSLFVLFVWTDSLRIYLEVLLPSLIKLKASSVGIVFFYSLIVSPIFLIVYFLIERFFPSGDSKIKSSIIPNTPLSFEEQFAALGKIPLFVGLEEADKRSVFNDMAASYFAPGEFLVKQGDLGDEFFIIVKGKAKAVFIDTHGTEYIVGELQNGDAFGEIALIDDVPRTASIISEFGCHTLSIKKSSFEKFVTMMGSPEKVKQIIRLSSFFHRHPILSRLSAKEKADIMEYLRFESIISNEKIQQALDQEENFYILYSGKLKVDTGDDSTDQILHPDDCFGGFGSSELSRRPAAQAVEGAGLLYMRSSEFQQFIYNKLAEKPGVFFK